LYHYFHGFGLNAFITYIIAVAPNFYGFLNQMGVKAPLGIERFYYVAYPTGLIVAFGVYYLLALVNPPLGMEKGTGWKEPKDYVDEFDSARYGEPIDAMEVEEVNIIREGMK
jgi:NCS1 family nucleobase:cation symporter-1